MPRIITEEDKNRFEHVGEIFNLYRNSLRQNPHWAKAPDQFIDSLACSLTSSYCQLAAADAAKVRFQPPIIGAEKAN